MGRVASRTTGGRVNYLPEVTRLWLIPYGREVGGEREDAELNGEEGKEEGEEGEEREEREREEEEEGEEEEEDEEKEEDEEEEEDELEENEQEKVLEAGGEEW